MIFTPYYVHCEKCGHRNKPDLSPRRAIRMALLRQLPPCRRCSGKLFPNLSPRPLLDDVLQELIAQGLLDSDGVPVARAPPA